MKSDDVAEALRKINRCWLEGRPHEMRQLLHPEICFLLPGGAGRISGQDAFITGFVDFCENARVVSFQEGEHQVDRFGDAAMATFHFEMVYERDGARYHTTGRDIWAFTHQSEHWLACWRTMVDVREEPA
jgi:ketosteroid isomerase-like protein